MTNRAKTESTIDGTEKRTAAARPPVPAPRSGSPFAPRPVLPNAFATPAPAPVELPDDEAYYAIVASAPAAPIVDVDAPAKALEVTVLWGAHDVLHVAHLVPPRAFVVGETEGRDVADFAMEAAFLGATRLPLTLVEDGTAFVVVPDGATVTRSEDGESADTGVLESTGELEPCAVPAGARKLRLRERDTVRVSHKGFVFQVKAVAAGKRVGAALAPDIRPLGYVGAVSALFGTLFLLGSFMAPSGSQLGGDHLDLDSRYVQALLAPVEAIPTETPPPSDPATTSPAGQAAAGDEGAMGDRSRPRTDNHAAVAGNAPRHDAVLAQETAVVQTQNAGALGVLATLAGAFAGPTSPYGAATAIGSDPMSALGSMLGTQIGENGGSFGLGMRGTGIGGGRDGVGTIGLDTFGTVGTRGSDGTYGRVAGTWREPATTRPQVTAAVHADVNGSLSEQVIRRVIQRHLSEVRFCYEQGLQSNPSLAGRVSVRFMISPSGAVQTAMVGSSSLGSGAVESCVTSAVRRWGFPQPEGGPVMVTYPFTFTPASP